MNAKEAREQALSVNHGIGKSLNQNQYDAVHKSIAMAVDKGEFETYYYSTLTPAVISILQEEGFEVEEWYEQREGILVTIKW